MQQEDEVRQEIVGTEGRLLVKQRLFDIAGIDLTLATSLQLVVAAVFAEQFAVVGGMVGGIAVEPHVGFPTLFQ